MLTNVVPTPPPGPAASASAQSPGDAVRTGRAVAAGVAPIDAAQARTGRIEPPKQAEALVLQSLGQRRTGLVPEPFDPDTPAGPPPTFEISILAHLLEIGRPPLSPAEPDEGAEVSASGEVPHPAEAEAQAAARIGSEIDAVRDLAEQPQPRLLDLRR